MWYMVHMVVRLPHDLDAGVADDLKQREKALCIELQKQGKWVHIWRVAGQYANYSVFNVGSHDELHDIISRLPLFPYMDVNVVPLAAHPSALESQEG